MAQTLFDKLWDEHVVYEPAGEPALLYIDLHLVHEVTSPQAFDGLRAAGRRVRRPDLTVATVDHNVPTTDRAASPSPTRSRPARSGAPPQLRRVRAFRFYDVDSAEQGIVHVIGPELGLTQPGMTIVCGDSHTSTHGAFGALAFGIGTSEVEHVLATQCLPQLKPRTMRDSRQRRARRRRHGQRPGARRHRTDWHRRRRRATSSSTRARRSARSRWKGA